MTQKPFWFLLDNAEDQISFPWFKPGSTLRVLPEPQEAQVPSLQLRAGERE
jgi:hypothetical protein